jgi:hypothetical protein
MKKEPFILLFLIFLIGCKTFDVKVKDEERYKGNPKKIQITTYDVIEFNNTIKKGEMKYSEILFFDIKNRIFKEYSINSKGDTTGKNCIKLFNKNELTIKSVCYIDSTENVSAVYQLNKNFKKSCFEFFHDNKLSKKRVFKYLSNKIDYIDYGYDKDNILKDKTLIIHDKKGRVYKSTSYDLNDNSIKYIIEHKYDKNGNEYEQNWYKKGQVPFTSYTNRKFDKKNNIVYGEKLFFNNSDTIKSVATAEYKYDKKGNIIFKLIKIDNKPSYIEEREITY